MRPVDHKGVGFLLNSNVLTWVIVWRQGAADGCRLEPGLGMDP
jgi:hypothetical protein